MVIYKKILTAIFILLLGSVNNFVQGQESELESGNKSETLYFKSESLFKCSIKLPDNYNPQKSYKLVVGLPVEFDDFSTVWEGLEIDFIYATPQAQYSALMNNKILSDWAFWSSNDSTTIEWADDLTADFMADLVSTLKAHYSIGDIYLMGFSQGAIFSYIAAIQRPQLYKGIICLSGPGIFEPLVNPFGDEYAPDWLEEKYLEPAKELKVFIAHGTKDQSAKYELGLKSNKILASYGYEVTFYSFDGGHTIDPESLIQVLDWINKE